MLMQRYKKLQDIQRDDDLDSKMENLMEGPPPPSVKGSRIARAPNVDPSTLAKSKLQKQLEARRKATETHSGNKTAAHTLKGNEIWAQQLINLELPVLVRSLKSSNVELG